MLFAFFWAFLILRNLKTAYMSRKLPVPLKKKSTKKAENKEKPFESGASLSKGFFLDWVYPVTCRLWYTSSI